MKNIGIINKLRFYVDLLTLKQFHFSLISPYLTYGIATWGSVCNIRLRNIKTKQNKCVRSLFFASDRDNAMPYFNFFLEILTIENIYKFKVALFTHKITNNAANVSTIFKGTLTLAPEIHYYNTRFASNLNSHREWIM